MKRVKPKTAGIKNYAVTAVSFKIIQVVDLMFSVDKVDDLKTYSYLHYEKLKHRSESSVRIDNGRVERLIFTEHEDGIEVRLIEIDSNHYGNKR